MILDVIGYGIGLMQVGFALYLIILGIISFFKKDNEKEYALS